VLSRPRFWLYRRSRRRRRHLRNCRRERAVHAGHCRACGVLPRAGERLPLRRQRRLRRRYRRAEPEERGREARWLGTTDSSHSVVVSGALGSPYSRSHRESHGRTSPASCFSVPATAPRQCGSRRRRSSTPSRTDCTSYRVRPRTLPCPGRTPPIAALAGAWLWAMGMHTFSAIPDIEPDRAAGIRTTATLLGEGRPTRTASPVGSPPRSRSPRVDIRLGVLLGVYPVFAAWVPVVDRSRPRVLVVPGAEHRRRHPAGDGGLWRVYPVTEALA